MVGGLLGQQKAPYPGARGRSARVFKNRFKSSEDIGEREKKNVSWFSLAWKGFFWPVSLAYGAGVRARAAAYRRGWLEVVRLPAPVLCVGNITVGGSGKTPGVIWLV